MFQVIKNHRKKILLVIQFVISIILIVNIFLRLDFQRFIHELASLRLLSYLLFLSFYLVSIILVAYKWWILLLRNGFSLPFFHVFKINWIGFFYNQFLPGRIGGDVLKIIYIMQNETEKSKISVSVVMDRIYNIIGILVISYVAIYINFYNSRAYIIPVVVVTILLLLVILISILISKYNVFHSATRVIQRLTKIIAFISGYFSNFRVTMQMIILALLYVMITIVMQYILGIAMDIQLPFTYYLFFVPLVTAITLIPISFGGLGIREVSFVILLSQMGISSEKAVAFSLIMYVTMVLFSIPGFFFQFFTSKTPNRYVVSQ